MLADMIRRIIILTRRPAARPRSSLRTSVASHGALVTTLSPDYLHDESASSPCHSHRRRCLHLHISPIVSLWRCIHASVSMTHSANTFRGPHCQDSSATTSVAVRRHYSHIFALSTPHYHLSPQSDALSTLPPHNFTSPTLHHPYWSQHHLKIS